MLKLSQRYKISENGKIEYVRVRIHEACKIQGTQQKRIFEILQADFTPHLIIHHDSIIAPMIQLGNRSHREI